MCCRWAGNFRPAPTDGERDAVLGSATRCLGERDAARHVATKKNTGLIEVSMPLRIWRVKMLHNPCRYKAVGLFPILDLFGGLPSRRGRLYGDCKFPFSISKISTFSAQ